MKTTGNNTTMDAIEYLKLELAGARTQRDTALAALRGLLASDGWQENIALEELPEIKQAHAVIAATQGSAQ